MNTSNLDKAPIIFSDLGYFLNISITKLFPENKILKESLKSTILKILESCGSNYINYLTRKYISMRFDHDIHYVGLRLLKELIEFGIISLNPNVFDIPNNEILSHVNLAINYKSLNESVVTTMSV
jgi:hypothetical protein